MNQGSNKDPELYLELLKYFKATSTGECLKSRKGKMSFYLHLHTLSLQDNS